jgi:hypothetical protein
MGCTPAICAGGTSIGRNIYVEDLAAARVKQLTSDGSDTILNGVSDRVYIAKLRRRVPLERRMALEPDGTKMPIGNSIRVMHLV